MTAPKALAFDVFGTVVDWRTGISRESAAFLAEIGRADLDAADFADAWRFRYFDVMRAFRESGRTFATLDMLHREMLEQTLRAEGIDPATLADALLDDWNHAWHRLDPWPDAVAGLTRLKAGFPIVTLTNGNIALMLAMARRARLALGRAAGRGSRTRLQARPAGLSVDGRGARPRAGPTMPGRRAP